jgi:MoxR-like ATPase
MSQAEDPVEATESDLEAVAAAADARERVLNEIEKRIIGQKEVIDLLLTALFAQGHGLFVGVPGLAKTMLISTLAELLDLKFSRIQFTPDLMPADITGTDVLHEDPASGHRSFRFLHGPIFANIILADEINRTPPKTQAALLQAMQEQRVSAGGTTHAIERPFLVFATQNPIEQEGTYPLPEAQLDRFMFQVKVDYPSEQDELRVAKLGASEYAPTLEKVLDPKRIAQIQKLVRRVPAADHVVAHAVKLCRLSRPQNEDAPKIVREYVTWGASPRASQYLLLAAKAFALLHGRYAASVDDVRQLAGVCLEHRLVLNYRGEAEGIATAEVIDELLSTLKP